MKNRVLRALLLGAALGGLVLAAMPAQAASLAWDDPKDDASDVLEDHPPFEITAAKVSNDGGVVKVEMTVPGLAKGVPTGGTAYSFRFEFLSAEVKYRLQVNEHVLTGNKTSFASVGTVTTFLPCEKCEGKIDREKKLVSITAPAASLGAPAAGGKKWTVMIASSLRGFTAPPLGAPSDGLRFEADAAPAPEGSELAF